MNMTIGIMITVFGAAVANSVYQTVKAVNDLRK